MKLIHLGDGHEEWWQRYSHIFRSNPHICGLTTQIMSFNILNEKKNYEGNNQIRFLTFLKTITISSSMRIFFLSLGFFHLFVFLLSSCNWVFSWHEKKCVHHSLSLNSSLPHAGLKTTRAKQQSLLKAIMWT